MFRWSEERGELEALHELASHEYPVLAVDFAAAGAVLLTAGLDGRACLWDVEVPYSIWVHEAPPHSVPVVFIKHMP